MKSILFNFPLCIKLKRIVAILAIFSFLAKDIASFSWDVWFYINQSEIAREKCENKAKPMLHCNGKCYLTKQLKKLEQKEQDHNTKRNPFFQVEKSQLFAYLSVSEVEVHCFFSEEKPFLDYRNSFSEYNQTEIFHPPIV